MSGTSLSKIFDLKGYILDRVEYRDDREILLHCHLKRKTMRFKSQSSKAVCAQRLRKIKHQVFEGRLVWLMIAQRRFYFSKPDKRLWEKLPNVALKKQTTESYRRNSIMALKNSTYSYSSQQRLASPMFSSRLVDELPELKFYWPEEITKIGLDGKNIGRRKNMFTLTDLDGKKLISALPPMSQRELINAIKSNVPLELRNAVKEVCIDMDKFMLSVVRQCFPDAEVVIDQFHVIQAAIRNLDAFRIRIQKMQGVNLNFLKYLLAKSPFELDRHQRKLLERTFEKIPRLKIGYGIIQELRKVYRQRDIKAAKKQLESTKRLCLESKIPDMLELAGMLKRWDEEILNYHLSKTTNAFTEGIHNRTQPL
ncbi:MAG: transposase [Candidatus Parcubacteria bacterium]|nr:transposase [Candidatus Parcubacteria bacterium]